MQKLHGQIVCFNESLSEPEFHDTKLNIAFFYQSEHIIHIYVPTFCMQRYDTYSSVLFQDNFQNVY